MLRARTRLQNTEALLEGLHVLQRAWEALWRQICEEADLHPSQGQALLWLLERGPSPMSDLADALFVAPSTITRLVEQMEKAGWVSRGPDPGDRRRVLVEILPQGEEKAWTVQALARQEVWERIDAVADPEGAARVLDALGRELGPRS